MSDGESILVHLEEQILFITLNRPDVLNSFNRPMGASFHKTLERAAADPDVRCLLITGAGRAFCAGQDLAEALPPDQEPPDIRDIIRDTYNPAIRGIRGIEKPVICAVNGVAAGAGANLALACDFVLASEKAGFIQAFSKIALIPDSGGTFFLPRLVGLARATEMAFLGDRIGPQQALDWGLIYRTCSPDDLTQESTQLARKLAAGPTRAYGLIKRAFNSSLSNTLDDQLELERELQGMAAQGDDYREGVTAFQEKRAARFQGC